MKYASDARGCFGVAMVRQCDGTKEGVRYEPFNYTGQKVIGADTYDKHVKRELARVKGLVFTGKSGAWKAGGYMERYPDTLRAEVEAQLAKGTSAPAGLPAVPATIRVKEVIEPVCQ